MTDEDWKELLAALRDVLRPHLEHSEPLRRLAHQVGQWLIEESWRAQAGSRPSTDDTPSSDMVEETPAPPDLRSPVTPGHVAEIPLRLGDDEVQVTVPGTPEGIERARVAAQPAADEAQRIEHAEHADEEVVDLSMVERRCRLKAESCRLFIQRRAATGDAFSEPSLVERMNEMIAEAKALDDCFLWAFWRERPQPDDAALRMIAENYDALAATTSLVRLLQQLEERARDDDVQEAFELLAEADSALHVALQRTWLTSPDVDQDEVHQWIRRETSERGIYLPRFMRLDDPADPEAADEVIQRAASLRGEVDDHSARLKQINQTFNKLRYHINRLDRNDLDGAHHNHRKMSEAIDTLITLGVPVSDRRFRRIIDESIASSFPPDAAGSASVTRVLEAVVEWHRGLKAMEETASEPSEAQWSDRIREVRSLIAGGSIVMIGGEPRNEAADRIREAFEASDVVWVRLSEHGTGQPMKAPIARAETRLVLVLTRLAGHLHTEEASGYAREAEKACVFLKAGYNPEQIAESVLQQASEQLRQQLSTS